MGKRGEPAESNSKKEEYSDHDSFWVVSKRDRAVKSFIVVGKVSTSDTFVWFVVPEEIQQGGKPKIFVTLFVVRAARILFGIRFVS